MTRVLLHVEAAVALVFALACGGNTGGQGDAGPADGQGAELIARVGDSSYALVDEEVVLDASRSTGAVRFEWSAGDGRAPIEVESGVVRVSYSAPGRYQAVVTAFDGDGNSDSESVLISVTYPAVFSGSASSTVAVVPGQSLIAAVSPDSDELSVFRRTGDQFTLERRVATCDHPRTVTVWGAFFAVPCQDDDSVQLSPIAGGASMVVSVPWGSRPYGAAVVDGDLFVTLGGTGTLARITADLMVTSVEAVSDARGITSLPGSQLAVTRWRSRDDGAEIVVVDPDVGVVDTMILQVDPQLASDTEIGGVPSYLNQMVVSPTGLEAVIPSLQANLFDGTFLSGIAFKHDTVVRATISFLDLVAGTESFARRKQFDNRGFASAAAYSSRGDFIYVALPGNRAVARYDALSDSQSGSLANIGFAPDGVAVSPDDRYLYVTAFMSRELVVYDVASFASNAPPVARLSLLTNEPLSPSELLGKQLFYDSTDPRLAKDGYLACAHCHLDGDSDNRVWDFTQRGEGLRNTLSLLGRAGTGDGPLHWSANFDEVQDFEHDIRGPNAGLGLMTDAEFNLGTRSTTLGDAKAGLSPDLDALAAYVASLDSAPRSPVARDGGTLSEAAERGRDVFLSNAAGCATCHTGSRFSDSSWLSPGVPLLHDVGTLGAGSGNRLGAPLTGLDTPTLVGLSASAPYLHDGSAASLLEVLTTRNATDLHGSTSQLASDELADLIEYLLSL